MKKNTTNRLAHILQLFAVLLLFGYATFPAGETTKEKPYYTSSPVGDNTKQDKKISPKITSTNIFPASYSITAPAGNQ